MADDSLMCCLKPRIKSGAPDTCNMGSLPNGGCEYLCLKAPQITDHSPKYTCACPDGMELGPDMRRCAIGKPTPRRLTTTASPPRSTSTEQPQTPAATSTETTSFSSTSQTSTSTRTPLLGPVAPNSIQRESNGNLSHRAASDHYLIGNNITVAVLGIVIPIVPILATVVIGLLCTGGYLVWRNWRRKNTKSMNFDNPVYRKTTEDDDDEIHIGRHSESIGHVYPARVALSLEDDGYP
ncbi:low-density lipoprotein receptor-related protein 8-like protein [Lates japonicus]|uniref:Low-density lipoprotein receptor-related protein 8-like protein n=1 Tax=Lates japonicus TaxID=270547 RepID=A0AAD3NQ62_LATJO|nr:low-density lipoprotein receptor-related protein 8-like protein [Lates japonicus]